MTVKLPGGAVHTEPAPADLAIAEPSLGRWMSPPPEIPPGWRTGPPDFVGVGTIRSGTTWWNYLIHRHPGVVKPPGRTKEVHYFDQFTDTARRTNPAAYHAYFPRPAGGRCGEWTPSYMFDAWVPPLLAQLAPDARVLVLLRDPIERMISALTYIRDQLEIELTDLEVWREFTRSLYGSQLQSLLGHFPRQQVLVLQYEQCARDTARQARRTFEFLGLDPGHHQLTARHTRPRNATSGTKVTIEQSLSAETLQALRSDLRGLAAQFPEIDQSLWPSASL